MPDIRIGRLRISPLPFLTSVLVLLVVSYLALFAFVMSYGALQVEFARSMRDDEAAVAKLEASYLAGVKSVSALDYRAAGYGKPRAQIFVARASATAFLAR